MNNLQKEQVEIDLAIMEFFRDNTGSKVLDENIYYAEKLLEELK